MSFPLRQITVAAALLILTPLAYGSQVEVVPGSAARGEALFASKGCVSCHAIDGEGGTLAPDLGRRARDLYTPDGLAAAMWNHAPRMWESIAESGAPIPSFSSAEAADLYSFFYSRLYFTAPGDAARGRRAFGDKNCIACHPLEPDLGGDSIGPPVSEWAPVPDPIAWAERMWDHADRMYQRMEETSLRWPRFTEQQMIDVLVYLRELPAAEAAETGFEPGEPELGREIFTSRCETCHGFRPSLPGRIDLLERASPMTMTGYAAAMWNHAPRMAADSDGDLARIEEGGMRHLISYLFAQRYFSGNGDPAAGARVYQDEGCATCHENAPQGTAIPDLSTSSEVFSPVTMTGALWRHGPSMLEALEERGMDWPVFEGSEMSDLIAYLNSRLVVRIAAGE